MAEKALFGEYLQQDRSCMLPHITYGNVDLRYGYFYELWIDLLEGWTVSEEDESWIVGALPNEEEMFWGEVIESRENPKPECPLDPNHVKSSIGTDVTVDLIGGPEQSPFVFQSDYTIVNEQFAKQLSQSGLKGAKIIPVAAVQDSSGLYLQPNDPRLKLYQLIFTGYDAVLYQKIVPDSANKCPFCGFEPLTCPACGAWNNPCNNCERKWTALADEHRGEKDLRIKIEDECDTVIDGKRWDGTDFFGECIRGYVTHRAVDFFLSVHAAPFKAQPIPVNIADLSEEDLQRLEMARKLLT